MEFTVTPESTTVVSYFAKPVIKQVPPIRETTLTDFQNGIKTGKVKSNVVPSFKESERTMFRLT